MIFSTSQIPFKRAFIINQLLINNDTHGFSVIKLKLTLYCKLLGRAEKVQNCPTSFLEYLLVGCKGAVVTAYTFVFFNKVQHGIICIKL